MRVNFHFVSLLCRISLGGMSGICLWLLVQKETHRAVADRFHSAWHSFPLKNSLLPFPLDLLKCRLYYPTLSLCVCIDQLRHWSVAYQALTSSTYFRHDDITFPPLGLATRHDVTSYEFESTYEMTRTTPFLGVDSHDRSRCQIARHGGIHQPHRRSTFIIIPTKPTPFYFSSGKKSIGACVCVCVCVDTGRGVVWNVGVRYCVWREVYFCDKLKSAALSN